MKRIIYIFSIFLLCIPLISICIDVFAEGLDEQTEKQIVNVGGTTTNAADGVEVSKTIESGGLENYFDITLQIKTKDSVQEIMRPQDLAIVVVMDISNTMIQYNTDGTKNSYGADLGGGNYAPDYVAGKSGDITRYASAITAATNFINEFATYSAGLDDSVVRKLGYVAFNTDAHEVFSLSECKSSEAATALINDIKTDTEKIVESNRYNISHKRFTNIEAGLKMASDMLAGAGEVDNKYIIFLSDGLPTTYVNTGYVGYDPYTPNATSSIDGSFYNAIRKKPCDIGTSYSDRAAIKARTMAASIKTSGITIYSVGTGIDNAHVTLPGTIMANEKNSPPTSYGSVLDTTKENYEIGSNLTDLHNWLRNSIGSEFYYNATDRASLEAAYVEIFKTIKDNIQTSVEASWVADDPMGVNGDVANIEFVGLYDDVGGLHDSLVKGEANQYDTAAFSENRIRWDLKVSDPEEESTEGNYIYRIKYRIRLENELDSFTEGSVYNTNGETTLSYVVRVDGALSDEKEINFKIPSVKGYLGNLEFTKVSAQNRRVLEGVKFELIHDPECECLDERVHASDSNLKFEATSDSLGKVKFTSVPSGHKYLLKEIKTLDDFILSSTPKNIEIRYDEVIGIPNNYEFENEIRKANLEISKLLEGNTNNTDLFDIKLEVWFEGELLSGTYKYKLNDSIDGEIKINEDNIRLGNNNKLVIYDLPVGAIYKISEITTNGYQVKYQVNSNDIAIGSIAICNSDNSCRLEEGSTNLVKIINYAEYELPDTGSWSMLIIGIIGTLLLVVPIIYIGYSLYINERSVT